MVLVIDSGGTKLQWRLVGSDDDIVQGVENGFQPLVHGYDELRLSLESISGEIDASSVESVYFYGAGCSTDAIKQEINQSISAVFSKAITEVDSDLLGAARALCDSSKGIACILGTGSNSCYFDGEKIAHQISPLGYMLGDEGSGAYLGKALLIAYCRNQMPSEIETAFDKKYGLSKDEIPFLLAQQDSPNKWLAAFAKFIFHHKSSPFIYELISHSFGDFFNRIIANYPNFKTLPVHFSGSIAFYFNDILRRVGNDNQVTIKNIVEGPIAGLALYHQKSLTK